MRALRGHPDRVLPGRRLVLRDGATRLDRRRQQPLVDEALLDDDLGFLERLVGRVGVAAVPVEGDVARRRLVQLRRAFLDRPLRVDDDLERLPVDLDQRRARPLPPSRVSATTAATPAPVNVTRSISSARGVATKFSTPPACQAHGQRVQLLEVLAGVDADRRRAGAAALLVSIALMRA